MYSDDVLNDFWARVDHSRGNEACWHWTGRIDARGHARFGIPGVSSAKSAHRVSFEIHHGVIPPGMLVWRRCRDETCVNPRHLTLGTRSEYNTFLHSVR